MQIKIQCAGICRFHQGINLVNKLLIYSGPPLFYIIVLLAGRKFTAQGLAGWYPLLVKPSYTPPGGLIAIVWTIIYLLTALSLIFFVQNARVKSFLWTIVGLYILNGILNAAWSYIFFTRHLLGYAVIIAGLIGATVALMIYFVWKESKAAAFLLVPYLAWASFATYLTYDIYIMN